MYWKSKPCSRGLLQRRNNSGKTNKSDEGRARGKMASKKKDKDEDVEPIIRKEVLAYKYSKKGQGTLYEAIILCGEPCFVTWYPDYGTNNESIKIVPAVEEATRIIRPPNPEEYPYTPFEFADEAELRDYFRRTNTATIDELYQTAKSTTQKYVDQDKNIIVILAADSIFTWFQDLFPVTHYSEGIGGNDVGKSSIGYTFAHTGYRVVRGASISGANYIRILGLVEPGQCVIIEDEADSISEDPDKVRILKAGYEFEMRISKTNMNTKSQETNWFYPFCYKMALGEKSFSEWKAKGLADRTFTFKCRPGTVKYSIKNVVSQTINKSPHLQKLYDELLDFRKLMLCYRLIHYADDLPQIEVNLTNRDLELTHPLLQLFYGTGAFQEIKTALQFFIKQRKERRSRSIQAAIYPILKSFLGSQNNDNIVFGMVWNEIISGGIKGKLNPYNNTEYQTHEYGPLYMNTLSKFIGDNFSADIIHKKDGSILSFNREKFDSYDDIYNHQSEGPDIEIKIEVKLVDSSNEEGDGNEGLRAIEGAFHSINNENEKSNAPPNAVMPSQPSPMVFIKCPHCKFENIHQEVIDHHIKYGHDTATG